MRHKISVERTHGEQREERGEKEEVGGYRGGYGAGGEGDGRARVAG